MGTVKQDMKSMLDELPLPLTTPSDETSKLARNAGSKKATLSKANQCK
jgi:hypothetical protein